MRTPWTSASFLLYAGGITIFFSVSGFLGALSGDYGKGAFVGWSLLVFVVLLGTAMALRASARPVAAGLLAVSAVLALVVFVGAIEYCFDWLADPGDPFEGFHVSVLLLEAVAIVASFAALRVFRFPLLVLLGVGSLWFFVTDVLSSGGNWTAVVSLAFGLLLLMVGAAIDRVYGFWVQVVAGLTMGGAVLYFWHSSDMDWVLIAIASVVYALVAHALSRSSYAVLGAIGLLLAATHFIQKWFASVPVPFFGDVGGGPHLWAAALGYAVYGLALMALGLALERRRHGMDVPPSS